MSKNENKTIRLSKIKVIMGSLVVFGITFFISFRQSFLKSDYAIHKEWARLLFDEFSPISVYPIWHFGTYCVYRLCNCFGIDSIEIAVGIFTGTVNVVSYIIICDILKKTKAVFSEWIALGLMLVSAIYMPWYNGHFYLGQGSPNVWHNPTTIMVKPFALIAFGGIVSVLENIKQHKQIEKRNWIGLGIILFVGVLAKPSFFQGIVPALGAYIIIQLLKNGCSELRQYLCLCATFIPAALTVIAQLVVVFFVAENGEGIGISPFKVMKLYSPSIIFSFVLAVCFPLLYLMFNRKELIKKTDVCLAMWLVLASWLEYALLYEKGYRLDEANFSWALNLSYTICWLVFSKDFWSEYVGNISNNKHKVIVLIAVWFIHLLSGLLYVWFCMVSNRMVL